MLNKFFKVAAGILNNESWPKNWLNVDMLAHKVILKIFDPVSELLIRNFLPGNNEEEGVQEFSTELWRETFYTLLKLLSSDQLVIEDFSPQVCFFWAI